MVERWRPHVDRLRERAAGWRGSGTDHARGRWQACDLAPAQRRATLDHRRHGRALATGERPAEDRGGGGRPGR